MSPPWTLKDMPSQAGKVAVVTGASSGLGYEIASALATAGAHVVLATRNEAKAIVAIQKIQDDNSDALCSYIPLDLTSLESIEDFAQDFGEKFDKLDLLINNAGVMAIPDRKLTMDGFEMQFGTNYLGHYALTARLLQYLVSTSGISRVVNVSSIVACKGALNFDDLNGEKKYKPYKAYAQSKLANLMFSYELQRQSDIRGWGLWSIAAHPGYAKTDLLKNGPGEACWYRMGCFSCCCGQDAAHGALSVLYAATSDEAQPGNYYGPKGCCELKGRVGKVAKPPKKALDKTMAFKLWEVSSAMVKIEWPTDRVFMVGVEDAAQGGAGENIEL